MKQTQAQALVEVVLLAGPQHTKEAVEVTEEALRSSFTAGTVLGMGLGLILLFVGLVFR